jgi:hypothetical protein
MIPTTNKRSMSAKPDVDRTFKAFLLPSPSAELMPVSPEILKSWLFKDLLKTVTSFS